MGDETAQPGRASRDIRGDKRKEETVMLSGENMADLVAQAKAGAVPAPGAASDPAPPAAAPATPPAGSAKQMNTKVLAVAAVGVVLLLVVLLLLIG